MAIIYLNDKNKVETVSYKNIIMDMRAKMDESFKIEEQAYRMAAEYAEELIEEYSIETGPFYLTPSSFYENGFSPEFIGRMPIITTVKAADVSMLRRILTEPKNSLTWQYIELMKMDNIELSFSEKTLNMIAAEAYRHGSGARGLRSVMEEKMKNIMFEIPEEIPKKSYKKQV